MFQLEIWFLAIKCGCRILQSWNFIRQNNQQWFSEPPGAQVAASTGRRDVPWAQVCSASLQHWAIQDYRTIAITVTPGPAAGQAWIPLAEHKKHKQVVHLLSPHTAFPNSMWTIPGNLSLFRRNAPWHFPQESWTIGFSPKASTKKFHISMLGFRCCYIKETPWEQRALWKTERFLSILTSWKISSKTLRVEASV